MIWGIAKLIGAPLAIGLAAALGWVWVTDALTIRSLRGDVTALTEVNKNLVARRDRLEAAIDGPAGWRVRLATAESNVKGLRISIGQQNERIAGLVRAGEERARAAAAALEAARAGRDAAEARYTVILNQPPQADIAKQALDIVFGAIPQ